MKKVKQTTAKMIRTTFVFLFLFTCFVAGAQQTSIDFLKRSSLSIHKAQKQMKATGTTEAGGNLAKAVLLQSYAVKLLAQNKQSEAICSSSMARRVAFEIIKNLGGKEDTFLAISDQEKTLIVNCQGEADILSAAKKELKQLSENDKDYSDAKSLNNNNIDLK